MALDKKDAKRIAADTNKAIGRKVVTTADMLPKRETRHSGTFAIDLSMYGGLPKGGIVQVTGDPGNFKTTMAYLAGAQVQRDGGRFAIADVECRAAQQLSLMKSCGLDTSKVLVGKFNSADEYMDAIKGWIDEGVELILIDSVGALVTSKLEDKSFDDADEPASIARLMNRFVRVAVTAMQPEDIEVDSCQTTVWMNVHQYEIISSTPGPKGKSRMGGRGKEYLALATIELRNDPRNYEVIKSKSRVKKADQPSEWKSRIIGHSNAINVKVHKNTIGPELHTSFTLIRHACDACDGIGCDTDGVVCDACGGAKGSHFVDNVETVMKHAKYLKMLEPGDNWTWLDAKAHIGHGGHVIPLWGKDEVARKFVTDNLPYCMHEIMQAEKARSLTWEPFELEDTTEIIYKGEAKPLSEFAVAEAVEA